MAPVDNNSSVSHGHACMFRYSESSVCETSVLHFIHNTLVKKYLKNLKNMGGGGQGKQNAETHAMKIENNNVKTIIIF